jgi:tetratricopeptide (TPR) repeat protein
VTATFDALFAELDEDSSRFLKFLSFLDPKRIPSKMLVEGAESLSQQAESAHTSPEKSCVIINDPTTNTRNSAFISPDFRPLLTLILSPIQREVIVQKLQKLSLVEQLFEGDQAYLRMHDLVQYMMGERAKKDASTYREWLRSTVSLVYCVFRSIEEPQLPRWWPDCEMLLPHLHSLNERWSGVDGVNLELAKTDVEMSRYLISQGRYGEAEAMCKRGVESFEKECGAEHPDTLDAVHALAFTYIRQERWADAEALGERVLAQQLKTLGADDAETGDSMNTLAVVYIRQGRYGKAEELLEGALAGFKKNLGPDHRYTFIAMNNLGEVYMYQERFDEAEKLLKRTLAGREKIFGPDHIDTLVTVEFLARVYESQKRYAEAEGLFKRALIAREKQLGSTHPRTLDTVVCLAHIYQSQGRYGEAEEYFKRAFTGRMHELGASHPGTERSANALAEFYRSQGRGSEADEVLNSLREGQEQTVSD